MIAGRMPSCCDSAFPEEQLTSEARSIFRGGRSSELPDVMLGVCDLALDEFGLSGGDGLEAGGRGNRARVLEAGLQAFFRKGQHLLGKFRCWSRAARIRATCRIKQQAERLFGLLDRPFRKLAQFGGNLKLRISHHYPACEIDDHMGLIVD